MTLRIKIKKKKLRYGNLVEITENIGCIPSGVYYYTGIGQGFLHFEVHDTAFFGVSKSCYALVNKVARDGKKAESSPSDFIKKYYALMAYYSQNPVQESLPKTYCAVDPRALKYLEEGSRASGTLH